jgi:hypothetical protein
MHSPRCAPTSRLKDRIARRGLAALHAGVLAQFTGDLTDGGTDCGTAHRNRITKRNPMPVGEPAKPFTPVRFRWAPLAWEVSPAPAH